MLCAIACAIVGSLVATRSAHADESSRARAARARLSAMVAALSSHRLDAFAAMFPDTDHSAVMFPSTRVAATGRKAIRSAAEDWLALGAATRTARVSVRGTAVVGQRADGDPKARSSHLVVVSADLAVAARGKAPETYRATAVLSDQLDPAHPQALIPAALFVSIAVDDAALRTDQRASEASTFDRFLDLLRVPDLLAERFDAGAGDIVIGTSVGERATGAEARKLLEGWSDRKLVVSGTPHVIKQLDWVYAMASAHVVKKGAKPAPINVLLVGYAECKGSCVGTRLTPHVVALHLGQPR